MLRTARYSQMNSCRFHPFSSDELPIKISELVDFAVEAMWIKQNRAIVSLRQLENHSRIGCRPNIFRSGH
jgi:hypothetical protein